MQYLNSGKRHCRNWLDRSVPYPFERWLMLALLTAYVLYRIVAYDFLAILFLWGLYILYLLVQFYTPSGLPDPDEDTFDPQTTMEDEVPLNLFEGYTTPAEDRPLLRTMNEFSLWKNILMTMGASWVGTLSDIFKLPVYWPFLFIYFVWLIGLAVHKHIRHMRKYGYSPSDFSLKKAPEPSDLAMP